MRGRGSGGRGIAHYRGLVEARADFQKAILSVTRMQDYGKRSEMPLGMNGVRRFINGLGEWGALWGGVWGGVVNGILLQFPPGGF